MGFSNQKSFAGSVVVAGACLVVGYLSGHLALFAGIAMIVVGGGSYVALELKGPEVVEVHFGDSVTLWKRYRVRRVINRFFLHLKNLRLNPPGVSPTISIGTHPVLPHVGGMGCEGPNSERGDRSTIDDKDIHDDFAIARAYSCCYFMRKTKAIDPDNSVGVKSTGRYTAFVILWDYFCLSFAGTKFREPGAYIVDRWISALLSMRLESNCGAGCIDKAMANVVLDLASGPVNAIENTDDAFSEWFWLRLNSAIWSVAFPNAIEKAETAKRILIERGALN